jgi:hypothetical protein
MLEANITFFHTLRQLALPHLARLCLDLGAEDGVFRKEHGKDGGVHHTI